MRETPEALFNTEAVLAVDDLMIDLLQERAESAPRRRYRLCMHHSPQDTVQEMVLAYCRGSYNRPHRHPDRSSSMYLLQGHLDVVVFDDTGEVIRIIAMGPHDSPKAHLVRLAPGCWHMDIPRSDRVVIHEIIAGPFDREKSNVMAPWSPEEGDQDAVKAFLAKVAPDR